MAVRSRDRAAEYAARTARGEAAGLSSAAARGHAKPGEPTARDVGEAARHPETVPLDVLRRATEAHARAIFRDERQAPSDPRHRFNDDQVRRNIEQTTDRDTLNRMRTISQAEWRELARNQVPGNPFFYH